MAERWKFSAFVVYGFWMSIIVYPLFGNWAWGGGWLAQLGSKASLGHGYVDFAGSGVAHGIGGFMGLAGAMVIGPRLGKYNKDGSANTLAAHNLPMAILGTFILAFGWFGFNPGSTLAATDLRIAVVAVNTMLASAAGAFAAMVWAWNRAPFKKPDPGMSVNGMLAGLVAITAPSGFVAPWTALVIGAVAGEAFLSALALCGGVLLIGIVGSRSERARAGLRPDPSSPSGSNAPCAVRWSPSRTRTPSSRP
jgi:Amt family ammonium transporter